MTDLRKKRLTTKEIVLVGMLAALSYVLMLIHLPFKHLGFLEVEFSDIPAIIAGFAYGPIAGILVELIKNLIKVLTATTTGGVGELANFFVNIAFVIPSSILYRRLKGKYRIVTTCTIATICMMIMGIIVNYFITVPLYCNLYGLDIVISLAQSTIPAIKNELSLILIGITPFNLLMGIMMSVVSLLVYKPFHKVISRA